MCARVLAVRGIWRRVLTAHRLQTGMRHAFGKPAGLVARVNIGQVLISVRFRPSARAAVVEALRRCKMKFPGRQQIVPSNKWGFTNLTHEQWHKYNAEGRIVPMGHHCRVLKRKGVLEKNFF